MSKVVKLRRHERIRRSSEPPDFIGQALMFREDNRWGTYSFKGSDIVLRCHSMSPERVGDFVYNLPEEEQGWVKRQSRLGLIELHGEQVGALEAVRYETDTLICTEEWVLIMDMDSAYEAAFGVVLGDAWENIGLDVTDFGSIIELRWAWTDPNARIDVPVTKLFKTLLRPWLPGHAILVLKAFPLEYQGYSGIEGDEGLEFDIAFRRRRRALVRLFSQSGFEPFPGKSGADGWMQRIPDRLKSVVTPPGSGCLKRALR